MKRQSIWLRLAAIVPAATLLVHADTVITFSETVLTAGYEPASSDTPKGTVLTDQLAQLGVIFATDSYGTTFVSSDLLFVPPEPVISGQYLTVVTRPALSVPGVTLTVTFVDSLNPAIPGIVTGSSIRVGVWDTNPDPSPRVVVRTYGLNGSLIEEQGLIAEFDVLSFTSGEVHMIKFWDDGGDGHVLDNLTFGPIHPVPEPGFWGAVGAGLTGLAIAARRRRPDYDSSHSTLRSPADT